MSVLTASQLDALAVLARGPARRTTGRTAAGRVNRQAVLALCRRGLALGAADATGTLYSITEEGRRAREEARGL